jgi:hypothetical protein
MLEIIWSLSLPLEMVGFIIALASVWLPKWMESLEAELNSIGANTRDWILAVLIQFSSEFLVILVGVIFFGYSSGHYVPLIILLFLLMLILPLLIFFLNKIGKCNSITGLGFIISGVGLFIGGTQYYYT